MNNNCLHRINKLNNKKMAKIINGLKSNIKNKNQVINFKKILVSKNQPEKCICKCYDNQNNCVDSIISRNKSLSEIVIDKNVLNLNVKNLIMKLYNLKEEE